MLTPQEKRLIRRYLIWCYKTTKEALDRIDRYYTQNKVDAYLLKQLKNSKDYHSDEYKSLVDQFEQYAADKKNKADQQKFVDTAQKTLNSEYQYLKNRQAAIENAIDYFLGSKEVGRISTLYEKEMTQRILQAREHT